MQLIQSQVKLQKTAEIAHLKAKKQRTRYRVTYLEFSKKVKQYNLYFQGKRTKGKVNVTFLAAINKEIGCAFCIYSLNYNRKSMVDAFWN